MSKKINTAQVVALKKAGQVLSESLSGHGSLLARRLSGSTSWRYQYRHGGKLKRYTFGQFSKDGDSEGCDDTSEYTLAGARKRAEKLSTLQRSVGDLAEHFKEEQAGADRIRKQAQHARIVAEQEERDYSLANLCKAYWQHLEAEGKKSASDARSGLNLWVVQKHPALAAKKASDVSTDDVLTILRAIIEAGKKAQTNRVRSYLRAAFELGLGSATDPLASSRASGFKLVGNPAAGVKRVPQFEVAGQRVLSAEELGALLKALDAKATPAAKAVTLSLRLGGQRISQLLAATERSYDRENQLLTIADGKGRRVQARQHVLPIVGAVEPLFVEALTTNPHPLRTGLYGGLTLDTVSKLVRQISREYEQQGGEPYCWRDLRRTCETMLAKMGISKDLRAQIQSHGLSGVQDRHYDKHQYIEEKRVALEAWNERLDELQYGLKVASNVISIIAEQ